MKNRGGNNLKDLIKKCESRTLVLEHILMYIKNPIGFFHIVSVNPENVMIALSDPIFNKIVGKAQIKIADGVGTVWAAKLLGVGNASRTTGADLMVDLLELAHRHSLSVMLIGGRTKMAEYIAGCQNKIRSSSKFIGLEGYKDITNPRADETKHIFSIVTATKPNVIIAAFGSPYQEKWFYQNQDQLKGIVCMGVGGGFDFVSGVVARAPLGMQRLGMEWFFRLIMQPWRAKRQLRLISFVFEVLRAKWNKQ